MHVWLKAELHFSQMEQSAEIDTKSSETLLSARTRTPIIQKFPPNVRDLNSRSLCRKSTNITWPP